MKSNILTLLCTVLLFSFTGCSNAQNPVNWTEKELMEPAVLAQSLKDKSNVPVIINIGPGAIIPNSIDNGTVSTTEGVEKLKKTLAALKKDQAVVVYCGCCPYDHCPNARPAVAALKEMDFTHFYLLDLPHNIKTDWIDKGYPVQE